MEDKPAGPRRVRTSIGMSVGRALLFAAGSALVACGALFLAWAVTTGTRMIADFTEGRMGIIFLICPAGLAASVWLTRKLFPGAQGSGIPQAMASLHMDAPENVNRVLSLRIMVGKILLTIVGILAGATIGREGPTVHVGASIMNSLTHLRLMRGTDVKRVLVLVGGAAGIAGAFNAPIAGVVFAIEELGHSFHSRDTAALVGAVAVGGVTTLLLARDFYDGGYFYFGTIRATLPIGVGYIAVVLLGVVCGISGGVFGRILGHAPDGFPRAVRSLARGRPIVFAACCGVVVAACDYLSRGATYGTGYFPARALLEGHQAVGGTFAILKYVALVASYLSGIPGGLFSPSLGIGAGIGAWFCGIVPGASLPALAMLGIVGYFAAAVQTPITAIVITVEMTNNETMLIPMIATAWLAFFVSRLICPRPVYTALADKFLAAVEPATHELKAERFRR